MIFQDDNGTELWFTLRAGELQVFVKSDVEYDDEIGFSLALDKMPRVIREMCEQAGWPEPLVLFPGGAPLGDVAPFVTVEPSPARSLQNLPGVMLGVDGRQVRLVRDEPLRVAAALVSAMRDAASEPDPAEVEELARVIRHELFADSERIGLRPGESDRASARAALRWMKDREARND